MHGDDDDKMRIIRGVFSAHSCLGIIIIINKIRYFLLLLLTSSLGAHNIFFLLPFYELRIWFNIESINMWWCVQRDKNKQTRNWDPRKKNHSFSKYENEQLVNARVWLFDSVLRLNMGNGGDRSHDDVISERKKS